METQTLDDLVMDDDVVEAKRARASAELDQITRTAKQALVHAGIDLELFFMVPRSGNAILSYGTTGDPDDIIWDGVRDIIFAVLRDTIDLERPQSHAVLCATTGPVADSASTTIAQVEPAVSR